MPSRPAPVLTRADLNRALLARQGLLEPAAPGTPVAEVVRRSGGIQSQVLRPSFVGIRSRLREVTYADVVDAAERFEIVRVAGMRNTLHLLEAPGYAALFGALQPALARALRAFFGKRAEGLDVDALVAAALEAFAAEGALTYAELKRRLAPLEPDRDPEALGYAVRSHLPLVQVPNGKAFGFGTIPAWRPADDALGTTATRDDDVAALVRRHLAAFGPATVADVQAWAGRARLKDPLAAMADELEVLHDEDGRELVDLPGAPRPPGDTPVGPLLLAEYDNAVLGHADRSRIIAEEHRGSVFLSAGRVEPTLLVDGVVAGTWRFVKDGRTTSIELAPFGRLAKADRQALDDEVERLLAWLP